MHLHVLDARGRLADKRGWMTERLKKLHDRASRLLDIADLDVVLSVQGAIIPETGVGGHAEPGVIFLAVDPASPAFLSGGAAALDRIFAHELHHVCRWDGPGYGETLGEALVSEGLAGHFVQDLLGTPLEPWEDLSPALTDLHTDAALRDWCDAGYDHHGWFHGTSALPRWTGYTLGFAFVAQYLDAHPSRTASALVHTPAAAFRPRR
jgi:uncharacterized protein YjaZ